MGVSVSCAVAVSDELGVLAVAVLGDSRTTRSRVGSARAAHGSPAAGLNRALGEVDSLDGKLEDGDVGGERSRYVVERWGRGTRRCRPRAGAEEFGVLRLLVPMVRVDCPLARTPSCTRGSCKGVLVRDRRSWTYEACVAKGKGVPLAGKTRCRRCGCPRRCGQDAGSAVSPAAGTDGAPPGRRRRRRRGCLRPQESAPHRARVAGRAGQDCSPHPTCTGAKQAGGRRGHPVQVAGRCTWTLSRRSAYG